MLYSQKQGVARGNYSVLTSKLQGRLLYRPDYLRIVLTVAMSEHNSNEILPSLKLGETATMVSSLNPISGYRAKQREGKPTLISH